VNPFDWWQRHWPDLLHWPDWSPETWTAIGTLALAAATVAVLFLQEPIRGRYARAQLAMSIAPRSPDVHFIEMRFFDNDGDLIHQESVLYVRVLVTHRSGRTAENVELYAAKVWAMGPNGERETVTKFLPMPLLWSNADGATAIRIPPGVSRHCDLGYLGRQGVLPTKLFVSTKVQPAGVGNALELPSVLEPGTYEIEVVLSGDNVSPIRQTWRIRCPREWFDDESRMITAAAVTPIH
jgi:hypothetical protein